MKKIICLGIVLLTLFSCAKDEIKSPKIDYAIPDSLNFTISNNSLKLIIKNNSNVLLHFNINTNNKIFLSTLSGDITTGNQSDLLTTINRAGLVNGKSYFKLYLTINNIKDSIVIGIDNLKEQKTILNSNVIDAEYSKIKDQLVFVSEYPSKVNILKSGSDIIQSIPLAYTPTCISISQDGETAAVGHDGHITYVNLSTQSIINTYNVSCFALDIVLGNNKWAYVFPKENQWTYIRCVNMNLPTDNEIHDDENQIYAGTKAKLDLSGKYIYGANNGLIPSDIEKYDIQNGVAVRLYDSPYHGDYPMNGNLWLSEDNNRIFTRGETVLNTSSIKSNDMIYNGTITISSDSFSNIEWLDPSSIKNNLYLIASIGNGWPPVRTPYVYIFDATNLSFKTKIELEKYVVPNNNGGNTLYEAEPYFVFSNKAGNTLFVITKAIGSGLANDWAIQKIAI